MVSIGELQAGEPRPSVSGGPVLDSARFDWQRAMPAHQYLKPAEKRSGVWDLHLNRL